MSNPTTATINSIIIATTESLTSLNDKIDTSGKVQERINAAISEIGDDFVLLQPTSAQTISGKQDLTSTGNLIVGATGSGNAANLTVNGNATFTGNTSTTGTTTSGNKLTVITGGLEVSAGGMTVTGNSTITGTLTTTGTMTITTDATIGTSGQSSTLTVHGNVSCTSGVTCATLTLPSITS